ncbi:MAG: OsmC family protein [Candidatus Nanopelagicales bacterium]
MSGTNSAVATWRGGWHCDVEAGGFQLAVDEPKPAGGPGLGPRPTDLFMASVASCYALAVAWAAGKEGVDLPDLEVTATGTYEGLKFAEIQVNVRTSLERSQVQVLLDRAAQVCYVSNTLNLAPPLTVAHVEQTPPG